MSEHGKLLGHPIDDYNWNECIEDDIEEILHYWLISETSFDSGGVTKEEKDKCVASLRYYNLPDSLLRKLIDRRIKHQEEMDSLVMQENITL